MPKPPQTDAVHVPSNYPASLIFVDESGSKNSSLFVIGAVKLRKPGLFARNVHDLRDRHGLGNREFKFSEINRNTVRFYFDLVDEMVEADAHLAGCVVNSSVHDPFKGARPTWLVHAEITAQLLVGCIARRELVSVLLDGISTPRGCALDDTVRGLVNKRFRATSVVSAACLDSKSTDGLQVADLVASAILFQRRQAPGVVGTSPKAKVATKLATSFGVPDLRDQRAPRVNIATYRTSPAEARRLRVVKNTRRAG